MDGTRISTNAFYKSQIQLMQSKNAEIAKLQTQVTTNQKYQAASEEPIATSKIRSINNFIQELDTYKSNATIIENRLGLLEESAQSILGQLERVNELIKQAGTGTLSNSNRAALAGELQGIFDDIVRTANTKDENGEYIFSGFATKQQAYTIQNGVAIYQGDQGARQLNINGSTTLPFSDSGYKIFENIKDGNGTFKTTLGTVTNTGTGVISSGNVVNQAAYVADTYTVQFVTNGSGNLGYTITGANTGQVIPALPATIPANAPDYVSNSSISFNGIQFTISGQPNVGDEFQIAPSTPQSIFNSLGNVINALKQNLSTPAETAAFQTQITYNAESLEQVFNHMQGYIAEVGSRSSTLDAEKNFNDILKNQAQIVKSNLGEIDPTEAIMNLNKQALALQLAQQAFLKAQNLSLLNFLR